MDVEMDTSPSYFDPKNLNSRELYRRYRERRSGGGGSSSISPSASKVFYDGQRIQRRPNTALFLEDIKQEVENEGGEGMEGRGNGKRSSMDGGGGDVVGFGSPVLKLCKVEEDLGVDGVESTFGLFASLLDSAIQGLMPIPDLILRFESACRDVSESIRFGLNGRHRVFEDKLMKQKAQQLLDEAASWSLLWHLFGKGNEELPQDLVMFPTTSHLEATQYVMTDHTAQLCLRIIQWLEGLASKALDLENKIRGSYIGSHLPTSGVWHHTQRYLQKAHADLSTIQHLDFDAPTREMAQQHPDDKKQDESLLEDIWTLLRAGRQDEACELCRSAGQSWRAATLRPFGGIDQFPSVDALIKNGLNRTLQAIELESGIGRQWQLWKWASYCASEKIADQDGGKYEAAIYASQCSNLKRVLPICKNWEAACWAMAKSWLDVQIDLELEKSQPAKLKSSSNNIDGSPTQVNGGFQHLVGAENWPRHVLMQQPRDLSALLQKLHSGELMHEAVSRGCKEQHRLVQMTLMVGDIPHLVDLLWSWISPSEDAQKGFRPHGDSQMIRFGAHIVLVLRYLVANEIKDTFREKLMTVGDRILQLYAMFLFSQNHEELVGIYASQLASHLCIELFVHMMELRKNGSVHMKYKIFLSAMEYLPFSSEDDSRGSFVEIIDRVLLRSREIKPGNYDDESIDVAEQHRLQSLEKATVVQWLCFTPPSSINNAEVISAKLLFKALIHSNILFREFALISMWRVPKMPIGAHMLLRFLAEPLKSHSSTLLSSDDHSASDNLNEFDDWREYYSCDATYRHWLKISSDNEEVSHDLTWDERQREIGAAKEALSSSLSLLKRKERPWLVSLEDRSSDLSGPLYLELHATAMLCLPSGECTLPDATLCAALTTALFSSVSEEVVLKRKLMVDVSISTRDTYCVEVVLRCLAVEGDGLEHRESNDGGILATIMATGFKGELIQFQSGVTMEISRLDAWYSSDDGLLIEPATFIVLGLCRRCCLPEVTIRCMQVSVSLIACGEIPECHDELIELVASSESGLFHLFSQRQLQEFLLFEREFAISRLECQEEVLGNKS